MASEIRLTAGWVAKTAGSIAAGGWGTVFAGVSIDTRTLRAGDLYVGIRGERFDGAEFAAEAAAKGAAGVMVARGRGRTAPAAPVVIEVDDATVALQALAHAVRVASGTTVVAITGSAGKTTTKEIATAEFLEAKYHVIRNRGNLNNHIGLPLSLMELAAGPDVAVVELGMSHAGEIRTLVRIAEPDVRVWTNVGDAHLGFFASVDAIADAKAEIFEGATAATVLVANADDERIASRAGAFAGRVVTFGIDRPADVRAQTVVDRGVDGVRAEVTTPRGEMTVTTPLVGRGNLANVLAATAVGLELDVPLAAMEERASRLRPASRRGEVVRLSGHVTVIDDSYNANPTATRRALDVLAASTAPGRRVAVLGEMLELGGRATPLHEDVGRHAADVRLDLLVTIGGEAARAMADAAVAAGLARARVRHFATSGEAADASDSLVAPGDLVLVKGSRGVRTDAVVDRLKARFALMLYQLLYKTLFPLGPQFSLLNVTRYVTVRTAAASLSALAISLALGPWLIRKLREFQIGQVIRQEGPSSHKPKAGTPTMGGLLILTAAIVPTLLWANLANPYVWVVVLTTAGFGAIGFADDYLKIVRRSHHGLLPRYKLLYQALIAAGVGIVLLVLQRHGLYSTRLIFPFFKRLIPDLGWGYLPFTIFVLVAWSNAVNLTDGLDGLAISTFAIAATTYTALAYVIGNRVLADYLLLVHFPPVAELTVFCGSLVGASLGFLWYNSYPAEIFMGDVGSLALGAALATVAILIKQELLLGIVGGVFVIELLSVVIQVASFKLTKQRVFKMAPLHHHFELIGWSEPKVITRFVIVGIVFALFSLTTLKLR